MIERREQLYENSYENVGVEQGLSEDISRRVIEHRNRFRRLIFNRFTEFMPLLINYHDRDKTAINFIQLEVALRQGYQVVVGKARNDQIMILGYLQSQYYQSSNDYFKSFNLNIDKRLTQDDITFTIPEYLRPTQALEIQHYDQCKSGDFIVLRNKPVTLNNDYQIVETTLGKKNIHVMNYIPDYYQMRDRCKAVVQTGDYGIHAQAILIAGYPSANIPMEWLKKGLKNGE